MKLLAGAVSMIASVLCSALPTLGAPAKQTGSQVPIRANADVYAGSFSNQLSDDKYPVIGGAVRANVSFAERWNVQFDVQGEQTTVGQFKGTGSNEFVHIYRRDPTRFAWGVYGGLGRFETPFFSIDQNTIGAEAQSYLGPVMLYGQAGYTHLTAETATADLFSARGQMRYFLDADTSIAADLSLAHLNTDQNFVADFRTVAITGMHRPANMPAALFASVRYDRIDTMAGTGESWTASVGIRFLFQPTTSTLKSNLQNGPAMDVLPIQYLGLLSAG